MIVTRRRRKPFRFRRLALPLVAIALVTFALVWPPSRQFIAAGPMAPVWRVTGSAAQAIAAPFHFAAQNEVIADRNRTIARLTSELTAAQNQASDKQKEIDALRSQIEQLQLRAVSSRVATPKPAPRGSTLPFAGGGAGGSVVGDLSAGATPDMRRTAEYWASMDPSNAAKIVQRLPPAYDARIFALMQPDAVGAILDALPPTFAAKLTQANPAVGR